MRSAGRLKISGDSDSTADGADRCFWGILQGIGDRRGSEWDNNAGDFVDWSMIAHIQAANPHDPRVTTVKERFNQNFQRSTR